MSASQQSAEVGRSAVIHLGVKSLQNWFKRINKGRRAHSRVRFENREKTSHRGLALLLTRLKLIAEQAALVLSGKGVQVSLGGLKHFGFNLIKSTAFRNRHAQHKC